MLRFRVLGASFLRFGCFVLRSSFSNASFSKLLRLTFLLYDLLVSRLLIYCKAVKLNGYNSLIFIGSFVITSESLSLFKVLSPGFIFT